MQMGIKKIIVISVVILIPIVFKIKNYKIGSCTPELEQMINKK